MPACVSEEATPSLVQCDGPCMRWFHSACLPTAPSGDDECLCGECAQTLRLQTNKCPICRQTICSLLQIRQETYEDRDAGSSSPGHQQHGGGAGQTQSNEEEEESKQEEEGDLEDPKSPAGGAGAVSSQ